MAKTIADELAKRQREISVAEFFEKNRHLLGFDSRIKAILTCVKEAVDNSIDACEEMIFELKKEVKSLKKKDGKIVDEIQVKIKDSLPNISVEVKYAQEEFRVLDNKGQRNGFLIIRHDDKNTVKISDTEIHFDKKIKDEINVVNQDMKLTIKKNRLSKNGKNDYTVKIEGGPEFITQRQAPSRFLVCVQDNGPGIIESQIGRIFGKLLYGSKFHRLKQGRGQQGIGISAAILYGQLTTGHSARIVSRVGEHKPASEYRMMIDTIRNEPEVLSRKKVKDFKQKHGTRIEIEVEGTFLSTGNKSIVEYLRRTSIANPHARIVFIDPEGNKTIFHRTNTSPPKESREIKPHPHGTEMGILMKMVKQTVKRTLLSFLTEEFTRVGSRSAKDMIQKAGLKQAMDPKELSRFDLEKLVKAMGEVNLMNPPTDCLSPIGHANLKKEIKIEIEPEFVTAVTRPPSVYRGMPFQVEAALAYGGNISEGTAKVMRFANKVPLMYEKGSCGITEAVSKVDWRRYNLSQPGGSGMPGGPLIIIVHLCSVWVPFKSEAKSAVASYPVIIKEIRLALQECARQLGIYIGRKHRERRKKEKISTFVRYSSELVKAVAGLSGKKEDEVKKLMDELLKKKFGDINGIRPGDSEETEQSGGEDSTGHEEPEEPDLSDSSEESE